MLRYVGNGAYCYANSMAMALAATGADYDPGELECLSGVAVSAFWAHTPEGRLPFFSSRYAAPDAGIDHALEHLGYTYSSAYSQEQDAAAERSALAQLREWVGDGPAIAGPLDMSRLVYQPGHEHLVGADHFVVVYGVTDDEIGLHDPAGYPYMAMRIDEFLPAWRAETIGYRRGSYSMWGRLRRIRDVAPEELYRATDRQIAACLRQEREHSGEEAIGSAVIRELAQLVRDTGVPAYMSGHLSYFSFPLGARRCADYARFYLPHDAERSAIKAEQGRCFGAAHVALMRQNWAGLHAALLELADWEQRFQERTLAA